MQAVDGKPNIGIGGAWLLLSLTLAVHVADEALTGFLSIYNPTVIALRQQFAWFPMPEFTFKTWLLGLALTVIFLLLLSPFAFSGVRWFRPLAYLFAIIMFANGLAHTIGTILGHTVSGIHFARPMPGFYSAPLLFVSSIYMLIRLRSTARNFPGASFN